MSDATATPSSALGVYEPSLDGMRGMCIAAVVAYHACAIAHHSEWVRGGFIGVSVFFTLSGFLITSLLLREASSSGGIALKNFWARRIRRLWPASFVVILVVAILSAADKLSVRASDAIAAAWSVTNWHVIAGGQRQLLHTIVGPLGPTWSLAVEEQFYLVLALLLAIVTRLRRQLFALSLVAVAGIVVPVVLANVVTDWHPSLEFNTVFRMPELFAGVLLAVWQRQGSRFFVGRKAADAIAAAGVVALLCAFLFVDYSPPWLLRGGYTLVAVVSAFTIAGLLQHGYAATAMSWLPLRWLGTISYSLYLVHWPVMLVLTTEHTNLDGARYAMLVVAASVASGWVLHRLVERPVRRMRAAAGATMTAGATAAGALTLLSLAML